MDKPNFASSGRSIPNVGATGLKITKVTAGRYFPVRVLAGKPHLNVVALGYGKSGIAGTVDDHAIRQTQTPQNLFRIVRQRFEFTRRIFRTAELDQFHLVELVLTKHATDVLPVGPSFAPETRC